MKSLVLVFILLVSFSLINSKLYSEDGPIAPEWPDQPKGMNGPLEYQIEILTLRCDYQILEYMLSNLERHGFKIITISCDENGKGMCIVECHY